jgi:DNA polymerase I
MTRRIAIVDGTAVLFRSFYALPEMKNKNGDHTNALYGFCKTIERVFNHDSYHKIVIVFDAKDNKKHKQAFFSDYKANRKPMPENLGPQFNPAYEYVNMLGIPNIQINGYEADDVIASISQYANVNDFEVDIFTQDKDFIPLVNKKTSLIWIHKKFEVCKPQDVIDKYGILPSQFTDWLAVVGDAVDNIPGVRGVGKQSATKLLQTHSSIQSLFDRASDMELDRISQKMVDAKEQFELSHKLVSLVCDIPFDTTILNEPLSLEVFESEECQSFFDKNSFHSLKKSKVSGSNWLDQPIDFTRSTTLDSLKETVQGCGLFDQSCYVSFANSDAEFYSFPSMVYISINDKHHQIHTDDWESDDWFLLFQLIRKKIICYQIKLLKHIAKTLNLKLENQFRDVCLMHYLCDSEHSHTIDQVFVTLFPEHGTPSKVKTAFKQAPALADGLRHKMLIDILKRIDGDVFKPFETIYNNMDLKLIDVIVDVEQNGVYLDSDKLEESGKEISRRLNVCRKEIYELADEEFNINSPKQLGDILFNKLALPTQRKNKTGHSTDSSVLESLAEYPISKSILEYRMLEKLRSTYVKPLLESVDSKTKRIHSTLLSHATTTGRLACQRPNLQNIPVRTTEASLIRKAFKPKHDNFSFISIDYSQIELRILAHLSADEMMCQAFSNSEDIHTFTASLIFGCDLKDVSPKQRNVAKTVNFAVLYGQGALALSKQLDVSMKEARSFINQYYSRYSGIKDYIDSVKQFAHQNKYVETLYGRKRLLSDIGTLNRQQQALYERFAVNTVVQGTAADMMRKAMIDVNDWINQSKSSAHMILQIHDELLFEVADKDQSHFIEHVVQIMESTVSLNIPLKVNIKVGKNWDEC